MVNYVNIHGKRIMPERMQSAPPKKSRQHLGSDGKPTKRHFGWVVTGIRPEDMEKARATLEKKGLPFDQEAAASAIAHKKVRSKPYTIRGAAVECADLVSKAGWINVSISEVIR